MVLHVISKAKTKKEHKLYTESIFRTLHSNNKTCNSKHGNYICNAKMFPRQTVSTPMAEWTIKVQFQLIIHSRNIYWVFVFYPLLQSPASSQESLLALKGNEMAQLANKNPSSNKVDLITWLHKILLSSRQQNEMLGRMFILLFVCNESEC